MNFVLKLCVLLIAAVACLPAAADDALWDKLKAGGYTVLIRHATAPGTGDPPGFKLDDCSTQRTLDEQGKAQARRIGEAFKSRHVPIGEVRSSQWCRCLETARIAFGRADPWPALNSNFNDRYQAAEDKNRQVLREIAARPAQGNRILVTHNYNIRDVTGVSTGSGQMVVVEPDGAGAARVVGTIPVPD